MVPESAGVFFSWGNVDGYPVGAGYDFSRQVYDSTPGAAIEQDLTLNEDAAHVLLGGNYRMPSKEDFGELFSNCLVEWVALNGTMGYRLTSNFNGKSIFIPASGFFNGLTYTGKDVFGRYWSSSYGNITNCYLLNFDSATIDAVHQSDRRYGFNIRPVFDPNT